MKKTALVVFAMSALFAVTPAVFACSLPVDVKIHKIVSNSRFTSADETMTERLRSQLRNAFSCRRAGEKQFAHKMRDIVNVDLVEIVHQGSSVTIVNIATDHGFFSEKVISISASTRERFERAMQSIGDDISESVCK